MQTIKMAPLSTQNQTNVSDFIELPNWLHNSPDVNLMDYSIGGGGCSAAAGISSED